MNYTNWKNKFPKQINHKRSRFGSKTTPKRGNQECDPICVMAQTNMKWKNQRCHRPIKNYLCMINFY